MAGAAVDRVSTLGERFAGLGYTRARRLLVAVGLVVLAVIAGVTWARGVDPVEVGATLLFVPIFLAFVFRGALGGVVAAVAAVVVYALLRAPAIDAVGAGEFTGLIAARAAAYLIFGVVGGWATQVLESSLEKLDLYDEVDDATGLYNARHLLNQTDLEIARARRYQTLFSVVTVGVPVRSLATLPARRRRAALRDLGRLLAGGVRSVDRVVHLRHGDEHRFVAILPETGAEGAEVFRGRFADRVASFLGERGASLEGEVLASTALTFPGDDERLDMLRSDATRIDAEEHAHSRPPAGTPTP